MFKDDKKTRKYISSLPPDKMANRSWENWKWVIIDFGRHRNQTQQTFYSCTITDNI